MYERHGNQTIFAFFDNFDAYHKGYSQVEKARALYKRYLHADLKDMLEEFKDDYLEMKNRLVDEFGSKHAVVAAITRKKWKPN